MSVEVELTPVSLTLAKGTSELLARRTVALLEKQAKENTASSGASLGRKKDGTPVTLSRSGALWRSVDYREENEACSVEFRKDYAQHVFREFGGRYNATELSPRYQQQLETEVAGLVEKGLTLEEE